MYCFSKFCCFCFRKTGKLKHLHETTYNKSPIITIVTELIPEMSFSELSRVLMICEGCSKRLKEMYLFRRSFLRNNKLLLEYVDELRSFGGDIGSLKVRMVDVMKINGTVDDNCYVENEPDIADVQVKQELYDNEEKFMQLQCSTVTEGRSFSNFYDNWADDNLDIKVEIEDEYVCDSPKYGTNEVQLVNYGNDSVDIFEVEKISDAEFISTNFLPQDNRFEKTPTNQETPRMLINCMKCKATFVSLKQLQSHALTHMDHKKTQETPHPPSPDTNQPKKSYKCRYCEKYYSSISAFRRHQMIHTGARKYECEICKKCFSNPGNLNRHHLIHTGERPFKCYICDSSFNQKTVLDRHLSTHSNHRERAFKCFICHKSFTEPSILKRHKLTHLEEKPFKCHVCGKTFAQSGNLKAHYVGHIGDKTYKCDLCEKSFVHPAALNRHQLVHVGENRHKCQVCGKTFVQLGRLNQHLLTHVTSAPVIDHQSTTETYLTYNYDL